jgi:hypothetical protein
VEKNYVALTFQIEGVSDECRTWTEVTTFNHLFFQIISGVYVLVSFLVSVSVLHRNQIVNLCETNCPETPIFQIGGVSEMDACDFI